VLGFQQIPLHELKNSLRPKLFSLMSLSESVKLMFAIWFVLSICLESSFSRPS